MNECDILTIATAYGSETNSEVWVTTGHSFQLH